MTTTVDIPAVEIACRSDPGRDPDKHVNEDAAAHGETKLGYLAVVCDGMGGHAGGKEAAELAVKTILEIIDAAPDVTQPRDALRVALEEANRRVWSMPTKEAGLRPGSTVVAVLAHAGGAEIGHVGDSRVYLVHAGAISQITKDHSMVQEMVDRNLIRAEDAPKHPDANKILRALGIMKDVEVGLRAEPIPFVSGDVFILCSDGLSDLVEPSDILQIAGSHPPAQAAGQLVDLANARGGHDNVTAMVVRMRSSASTNAAATIVKTMPVTQHASEAPLDPTAKDQGSGPRGTVLAAPASAPASQKTQMGVPAVPIAMPPIAIAQVPPPPPSMPANEPRSRLPIIIGILLAVVALGIAAVFVWATHRKEHVAVPFVEATRDASAAAGSAMPEEADAAIADVPPLPAPIPTGSAREPGFCVKARQARAKGSPSASKLEDQCRAAGGTP